MSRIEDASESTIMKIYVTSSFLADLEKGATSFLFIFPSDIMKQSFLIYELISSASIFLNV